MTDDCVVLKSNKVERKEILIMATEVSIVLGMFNRNLSSEECIKNIWLNKRPQMMTRAQAVSIESNDPDIKKINTIGVKKDISSELNHLSKQEIKEKTKLANCVSGILNEKSIADIFYKNTKQKIHKISVKKKSIYSSKEYLFSLIGRADGFIRPGAPPGLDIKTNEIRFDDIIVEIKWRRNGFIINEYEKMQIYMYMFIYDVGGACIIQKYNNLLKYDYFKIDYVLINKYLTELIKKLLEESNLNRADESRPILDEVPVRLVDS